MSRPVSTRSRPLQRGPGQDQFNAPITESEVDERKVKPIFTGAATGIRNPRWHEIHIGDKPDEALDYLGLASPLLRRLDVAGSADRTTQPYGSQGRAATSP